MNKLCKQCQLVKSQEFFYKNYNSKQGKYYFASYCIECSNERSRKYHHANRHKRIKQNREWSLSKKYKITGADYIQIYESQGGVCKICNLKSEHKRLAVDHSHSTGEVRGLLCENCNRGLGMFKDNKVLLQNAIAYLSYEEETNESQATQTNP